MPEETGRTITFTVNVGQPYLALLDEVGAVYVTGDLGVFGEWVPGAAVRLQKSEQTKSTSVWTKTIELPADEIVNEFQYRYFIGCARFVSSPIIHVIKWESAAKPRCFKLGDQSPKWDEFGQINGRLLVTDGWISDPKLTEIRFSLFRATAIQLSGNDNAKYDSYKVSLYALAKGQGSNELTIDGCSVVSSAVLDDEKRLAYRLPLAEKPSTEIFTRNGPNLLSFRVQTANSIENVYFRFSVTNTGSESFLAVADVKPLSRSSTQGTIVAALIDKEQGIVVGKITATYLLIFASTPSVLKFSTMEKSFVNYWTMRRPLDIGHRGMGKSYTHLAKERENTLKSMVTAYNMGADYVEFDVQLSKDEVPVLYHDFHICLETEKQELKELSFCQLTFDQLNTLNIRHHYDLKKPDKRSHIPVVDRISEKADPACRAFPTLKEVLMLAPQHLGFNIEFKYPMYMENGHFECEGVLEPNAFVDRILEVIATHGNERRVVFSSFCPEICTILKLKQNRYPTFFLTQGVTDRYVSYQNPVTMTSDNAIAFALNENLLGVCFHSEDLLRRPELIQKARGDGLVSFVWGDDLDETKNIEFMRQLAVDGVIYDRIDEHTPGKRNVFQIDTRLPEWSRTFGGGARFGTAASAIVPTVQAVMTETLKKLQSRDVIDNRWEVTKLIGEGGFGAVYEVKDTSNLSPGRLFALKVEDANAPLRERVMRMEVVILRRLRTKRVTEGHMAKRHFCDLEAVGQTPAYRYMVMTLVGKSISHLRRRCGGKFAGRTVAHVASESLTAIQELHEIGFLHRDIKPSNMAIGTPPQFDDLYLIDFGLCRSYRHDDGRLRRPRDVAGFRGTLTYAPLACHRNEDMCRRDDLWSWLYMLIELTTGKLAWHATMREVMSLQFKVQVERVGTVKRDLNANPLELMSGCAVEFMELHAIIASLGFYDPPNYAQMQASLKKMETRRRRPEKDGEKLDWEPGGKYHDKIQWP